ncbi:unnamed protein product [Prorocentrum cordatum]|uniref:Uncharacterized protein n=1 Tax=Prorocentrum cordatum TaxID=2364126 RepID=A0ABN9U1I9_9DINO|nr:unnamed protein product [Polarella glacialis]
MAAHAGRAGAATALGWACRAPRSRLAGAAAAAAARGSSARPLAQNPELASARCFACVALEPGGAEGEDGEGEDGPALVGVAAAWRAASGRRARGQQLPGGGPAGGERRLGRGAQELGAASRAGRALRHRHVATWRAEFGFARRQHSLAQFGYTGPNDELLEWRRQFDELADGGGEPGPLSPWRVSSACVRGSTAA